VFQSRMFPGEKRFRLGSVCIASFEGAFLQVCVCGCSGVGGDQLMVRGKMKKRRGSEKWRQSMWMIAEANHVI